MRKSIAAAALIAALAATAACSHSNAEDAGPTTSRSYNVGNFQQIEVAGPYNVEVRTGSNIGVSATGNEKLLDHTRVEVDGNRLQIGPEKSHNWFGGWKSSGSAKFVITVPQLTGASIGGSGDIQVDRVQAPNFEGNIGGSGTLSVAALEVQTLKLKIGGSGGIKAGAGKAQIADYSIGGSGSVDAGAVAVDQLKVNVAGSGNVRAHATGSADVNVVGSGDVEIAGGAKCKVNKMGSGDVRCS